MSLGGVNAPVQDEDSRLRAQNEGCTLPADSTRAAAGAPRHPHLLTQTAFRLEEHHKMLFYVGVTCAMASGSF